MRKGENISVSITLKTIIFAISIPLVLYFLWFVRDILFSLLIAFIIMSALRPGVSFLVQKKVPRNLAILFVFVLLILFLVAIISIIIPPIVIETTNLLRSLPIIFQGVFPNANQALRLSDLTQYIPNVTNNVFGLISSIFSNTLFVVTTLFFSLYFTLEENLIGKFFSRYFKKEAADRYIKTIHMAERRMASWFWGEVVLMTVVGVFTYIGLTIIGVKHALPLAVLAGLLEIVPNIGPVLSAIPAVIIGLSQSYFVGFSSVALYVVIQQFENNLIVPVIMKRAVGLNPILTLIALLLGGRIGGTLGIVLAIPILLFVETILSAHLPYNKDTALK